MALDRSVAIATKVTPDEAKAIKDFADREGMTSSEFLRAASLFYMALRGNTFALKLLGRGVLRVASDMATLARGWADQHGWSLGAGRGGA